MKLYIDPGTGSMLFTILIGLFGTAGFLFRNAFVKLRFLLSSGTKEKDLHENCIPFVIFSDHKRYWSTFEPICNEFEKRGEKLIYMTASADDPALDKVYQHVKCEFIGEGNRAFAKLNFLKADILLSTTPGLDVYQWKKSKGVNWYVHVLHMANDPTTYRMFGLDYYDAVLLSGDYQIRQIRELERLRGLPEKELKLVGVPYLDAMLQCIDNGPKLLPHPITVLLAPSWGKSSILSRYGETIIDALLDTGYKLIIRPHPQSFISEKEMVEKLIREYPDSEQLECNRDSNNFDVLCRSDILISDFSGIIFDFALAFQKPVIYADTSFDKSPYDAAWLKEEMWTFTALPRIGRQLFPDSFHNIKALIDDMLADPEHDKAIETVRQETWAHIGESASLVVDYMINKSRELPEKSTDD